MTLFALFGGMGEFDDWAEPVHLQLIEQGAGDGTVCVIPLGIGLEYLEEENLRLYGTIGIPCEVVPVDDREGALREENGAALSRCSSIFLHGGMPAWIIETLAD